MYTFKPSLSLYSPQPDAGTSQDPHPIDILIQESQKQWTDLRSKEVLTLEEAAKVYRRRRGRHPPPQFDEWLAFAQAKQALLTEEFFDRIYDDLNPFWAIPSKRIRTQASGFEHRIIIRGGIVSFETDQEREWMKLWSDLVTSISSGIPDLDMAINVMDESRVTVPWEKIHSYMKFSETNKRIIPPSQVITKFSTSQHIDKIGHSPIFENGDPWKDLFVPGCHPDSAARQGVITTSSVDLIPQQAWERYVTNWTDSKDPCNRPELQNLHGAFIEPISKSTTQSLLPLFGGSKLSVNNEILLPSAMYWTNDPFYSGGNGHGGNWDFKANRMVWRGAASGGRNRESTWPQFHRHRFVAIANGTAVDQTLNTADIHPAIQFPNFSRIEDGGLGPWLQSFSDVAFVHLLCFPDEGTPTCSYTDPFYSLAKFMPMQEQLGSKYLADLDGNSFSGRYRSFLLSTSLPIKSTIFSEWHDSRLIPWVHFIPMDNTFGDFYGIMEYFLGRGDRAGHDKVALKIAEEGKEWAQKVLRKEDMQVYVYRLLLEYARICDDERERLGFVGDLRVDEKDLLLDSPLK